ncbi:hypothetical protein QJ857_gp1073 [Tupanvirus soda lake]|uniref:Uncharacterized protein n=2 Tax=Tupanvirus TaxID=2094720 RepID=A0A6N1P1R1_9VIRU|nr:hypothetical protein QJ857_gp1073 [Tupanvirus soda lake]QKU34981.1 hypothetical protein [Tupanvirus soda lake]
MHRRRRQVYSHENPIDDVMSSSINNSFFSDNFKTVYNDMQKTFPPVPMADVFFAQENAIPSILNFELNNNSNNKTVNNTAINNRNKNYQNNDGQNHFTYFENEPIPPRQSSKQNRSHNTNQKIDNNKNSEKCGIKTLLNKSKMSYPFDKQEFHDDKNKCGIKIPISEPEVITESKTVKETIHVAPIPITETETITKYTTETTTVVKENHDAEKVLQQYIDQEGLGVVENFIETVDDNKTKNITDQSETPISETVDNKPTEEIVQDKKNNPDTSTSVLNPVSLQPCVEANVSTEKMDIKFEMEPMHHYPTGHTGGWCGNYLETLDCQTNKVTSPIVSNIELEKPVIDLKLNVNDNYLATQENLSDIESRMTKKEKTKKIDIKSDDNTIVNINSKQVMNNNMEDNTKVTPTGTTVATSTANLTATPVVNEAVDSKAGVACATSEDKTTSKDCDSSEAYKWPELTIENVNTTFKVVGDLKEGVKVKIVGDRYLAEDNSYVVSFSRSMSGQGRDKIMSFLNHLFDETKRNILMLLADIRNGNDVDNKVSELENMVGNMVIFLHKFDTMRNVYKGDTGTHAKLGVIRNKFFTFRHSLFRDLAIPKQK